MNAAGDDDRSALLCLPYDLISGATIPRVDSDADDITWNYSFSFKRRDRHVDNDRITDKIRRRCARDNEEPPRSDHAIAHRSVCRIHQYHLAHHAARLANFSAEASLGR